MNMRATQAIILLGICFIGLSVKAQDWQNLLMKGIMSSNLNQIQNALQNGAQLDTIHYKGLIPLGYAVHFGKSLKIIGYLIEKGANINFRDQRGVTALVWAAWAGKLENVVYLVDHGADVNVKCSNSDWNMTPLLMAINRNHKEVVDYLKSKGAKEDED